MRTRVLVVGVLLAGAGRTLPAQQVSGVALEAGSNRPLPFVEVAVMDGKKQVAAAVSDAAGRFVVPLMHSGTFKVRARLLGYRAFTSDNIAVAANEDVRTELVLAVDAIPIEPLRVTARAQMESAYLASMGYYDRQRAGLGHFVSRAQIEKRNPAVLSEVLSSVPGVKLTRADRGAQKRSEITFTRGMSSMRQCMPAIFIDGALMRSGGNLRPNELPLDEWVNPRDIEGIELYHGAAATPAIYNQQAQCGVVAIWTKRRK
jgi:hypothetical protein